VLGFGTRCRPFTSHMPKPLLPFCGMPMIMHVIKSLEKQGVSTIIISLHYLEDQFRTTLARETRDMKVNIVYVIEEKPMGTAGAIRYAQHELEAAGPGPFYMFNADIIAEYPLKEMAQKHSQGGRGKCMGTILLTRVNDPHKYGVARLGEDDRILGFTEKPQVYVGDLINAGAYILEMDVIKMIPENVEFSIERKIFPLLASEGTLNSFKLTGFWKDLGNPADYLDGQRLYLMNAHEKGVSLGAMSNGLTEDAVRKQPIMMQADAVIGSRSRIGPNVVVDHGVFVGDHVHIANTLMMEGAVVGAGASVKDSILGWESIVGDGAVLESCHLGYRAVVAPMSVCRNQSVASNERFPTAKYPLQ